MSAEGSDECEIATKTILTEKESSESFNIAVPIQLFPLASVTIGWAVLVGDTDEKGSPLWWCRARANLAGTSFEIGRLAMTSFNTIRFLKIPYDIILLAKNP
jgi:hypothetical protein